MSAVASTVRGRSLSDVLTIARALCPYLIVVLVTSTTPPAFVEAAIDVCLPEIHVKCGT
jgi:hypothetical protein